MVDDSIQAETYRSGLITKLAEKFKNDPRYASCIMGPFLSVDISIWEDSPRSSPTAKKSKKDRRGDSEKQKKKKRSRSRERRKRSRSRSR